MTKTHIQRICILLFLLIGNTAFSQKSPFTKVVNVKLLEEKINENSNKITTIKSDFIQEKKMDYIDEVITSKGKFWYKKENNLRWEYFEPYVYIIAIKNGKFSIKDGKKVSTYDIKTNVVFKEINDLIISMAKGNMMKDNKFYIDAYENNSIYLLKLTPKDENMKKFILKTEVYIDKSNLSVSKVIMKESDTDYTVITFLNRKMNEEIQDAIFNIN